MVGREVSAQSLPPLRPPARALILTGFMGAGKTVVGQALAMRLGLPFTDTDDLVAQRAGKSIVQVFAEEGEPAFRALERQALLEAIETGPQVLATGGGMITWPGNVELMRRAGPILWLRVDPAVVMQRVGGDTSRPLLNVDDPTGRVAELLAARRPFYELADYVVDTSDLRIDETVDELVHRLATDPRACIFTDAVLPLRVAVPGMPYTVLVSYNLSEQSPRLLADLGVPPARVALVTAEGPCQAHAERLRTYLAEGGWEAEVVVVPDSEASKSLRQVEQLYEQFLALGLDRASVVIAVGGGMVGDLGGLAAATFLRGVRLVQVPTTVLAQIDSSIGGKVAVNLARGKNLMGTFYQPVAVLAVLDTLGTLPRAQFLDGLVEGIKHALLFDRAFFEWLEGHWKRVLALEPWAVRYFIARNVQIKAQVVQQDPHEVYLRALLNLGHTVGHALERAAQDWALSHGQAVAIGMVAEVALTTNLGLTAEDVLGRVSDLLEKIGLPTKAAGLDGDLAASALSVDKKLTAGRLTLPIVTDLGKSMLTTDVPPEALLTALRSAMR